MRLAFIGTGKIIHEAMEAVSQVPTIEMTAVYAREHSLDKAENLAFKYSIPEVFTDYDLLLNESTADTVYIGLVNSAHYPYAKKALEAGMNVILEKPFTGFYSQAEELKNLAEEKGLFVLEAITVLHNPLLDQIRTEMEGIGTIRMMLANYSQYSSRYDNYLKHEVEHAFDREYYGGALYDINIYNIHYAVALFGMPEKVQYYPNLGYNGIDTSGVLILEYPGFTAVLTGAKDSDSPGFISIQGEKGYIKIDGKPNSATELKCERVDETVTETTKDAAGATVRATLKEDWKAPEARHRMIQEFEDFSRIIDENDTEEGHRLMQESVDVISVLEKARESAGIEF